MPKVAAILRRSGRYSKREEAGRLAITLSVSQSPSGDKLLVYAHNVGDHVAIIDHIVVSGGSWSNWFYQDDFVFGSGRVGGGLYLMVQMPYSGGATKVHATADYWEVDQRVKSPEVNVS